jgi:hypothetical protein
MADGGEEGNAAPPRRRRGPMRASLDADELMALMHGSDPVRVELTRLENELRGEAHLLPRRGSLYCFGRVLVWGKCLIFCR